MVFRLVLLYLKQTTSHGKDPPDHLQGLTGVRQEGQPAEGKSHQHSWSNSHQQEQPMRQGSHRQTCVISEHKQFRYTNIILLLSNVAFFATQKTKKQYKFDASLGLATSSGIPQIIASPKFGIWPLRWGMQWKPCISWKSSLWVELSCQLELWSCWLSCTRSIAEEFGHGESVIWTYLPPGPSNPALHLLLNALGTLLLDKQTLDTLVAASNLITSVILWISWGHCSLIDWHYMSALSTQLTLLCRVTNQYNQNKYLFELSGLRTQK